MRWWLLLVPAVTLVGLALGRAVALPLAIAGAVIAGGAAALVLERRQRRLVLSLADEVNAWLGPAGPRTLRLPEETPWRQLGIALNALGASYARRGLRLRLERPWRRELMDAIVAPALLFSSDDRLLAANESARDLLSVPEVDDEAPTLVQALGSAAVVAAVREARGDRRPVEVDADLGRREVRATASPVGDEVLVILRDLTEQRRVEELRRGFVANASHELKTPVTSIGSLTDALEVTLGRDPERARALVSRLSEESDRLARLAGDLLDLRLLEERGPLERGPVDLVAVVREVVRSAESEIQARRIGVELHLPETATVVGVEHELRLVVDNVIRNAVTYNEDDGRLEIEVSRYDGGYELAVSDTGIGIPQDDLERIFERFYRVDVARSRERGGTGLGLSIVRHAVLRHGGSIQVDSLLGEGSTFRIRLPIEPR